MERLLSKRGRDFWGESYWNVLHSAAAFYTPDRANDYILLIQGYKGTIPCRQCRIHFAQNLTKYPIEPYLVGNKELLFWTYIIHDAVNQSHNEHRKDEPRKVSPSFPSVMGKYMKSPPERWDRSWCFVLHASAAVFIPESTTDYMKLVKSYLGLIPSPISRVRFGQALERCPVETYLRNNHDLFFWSYVVCDMLLNPQDVPSKPFLHYDPKKSTPYINVKRYYYAGVGEECKECSV